MTEPIHYLWMDNTDRICDVVRGAIAAALSVSIEFGIGADMDTHRVSLWAEDADFINYDEDGEAG